MRPVIFIGTPCYGGVVTELYLHSLIALMSNPRAREVDFSLRTGHDSLVTRSRNTIAGAFLDSPAATHLLFIDADIGFAPEAVFRLIDLDVDLAAGMYPVKFFDWSKVQKAALAGGTLEQMQLAALHHVGVTCQGKDRKERDGFVTGLQAGCGFMLIKRAVFERLKTAHPELHYKFTQTNPPPPTQSENLYSFFDCVIDSESGAYLSEDFAFCKRFREAGGELWLDVKTRLLHTGIQTFGNNKV